MNKITLTAEGELEDKVCRNMLRKIMMDIEKLNTRTKIHTIKIKELEKK